VFVNQEFHASLEPLEIVPAIPITDAITSSR
jgi:hypothetical protein